MSAHLEWNRLNDLADGRHAGEDGGEEALHLAECARCQATLASLRELGIGARRLPPSLEPPDGLWGDIAATIAASRTPSGAPGHGAAPVTRAPGAPDTPPRLRFVPPMRWLAAAAVVLMALSSAVTALFLRGGEAGTTGAVAQGRAPAGAGVAAAGGASALPASFVASESAYLADLATLHAAFVARRHALSPATIAVVERSLAAIDEAITEARTALLADPANQTLAELLSITYRQKVELLRRAAEYSQSL